VNNIQDTFLFKDTPLLIMVFNGHGTCLSVNPWGMHEMNSKGDIVGRHFLEIWHSDFKQEAEKHMSTVLAGQHSTFEAVRHNGDDLAWWSVKLKPILDSSNNHAPKFILFGSNISEEKQTKNWLNSLRNTEERYLELENILNSMLDPVHITNRDFELEFSNRACREIFGFHIPGIKCYKYFHNLESPCQWCRHEEVMMGKSYRSENYFERKKSYFDSNHSPITKANGEIAKLVILRDITAIKAAHREQSERFLNEVRLNALLKLSQMHDKTLQEVMDFGLEEAIRLTDSKI
jgi:PAS domain S-box-containing protein